MAAIHENGNARISIFNVSFIVVFIINVFSSQVVCIAAAYIKDV